MPDGRQAASAAQCQLVAALAFAYILLFELVFFFHSAPWTPLVLAGKVGLPLVLLIAAAPRLRELMAQRHALVYTLLLLALMAWALVATLLGRSPMEGVAEWLKHVTRVCYFVALVVLFRSLPGLLPRLSAFIVVWGLISVVQYVGMVTTGAFDRPVFIAGLPVPFGGPLGVFGVTVSVFQLPGLPAIVRFHGWWNEPANASAFMLAAAFLASSLAQGRRRTLWRLAALLCGAAGLLSLSNAGFVAFGSALALGAMLPGGSRSSTRRVTRLVVALPVAVGLVVLGATGRWFARNVDNLWLRAITGVRTESVVLDPTSGRLALGAGALRGASANPVGEGFGYMAEALEGGQLSASAPLLWLTFAGVPGLVMLLVAVGYVLVAGASSASRSRERVRLVQAWTCVVVVQLNYGLWMNPLFLTLAAAALTETMDSSQRR